MIKINPVCECTRCGNSWWRRSGKLPKKCPACGSPNWNRKNVRSYKKKGGVEHEK